MSAHGFHVHGPHDHEVEQVAHSSDAFSARIAVTTAILATIGALFSYEVGETQNDALLYKNDSAIRRTEASDQWNYYQAKSSKQNLAELGAALATGDASARFKAEAERYNKEKQDILADAQKKEKRSEELEAASEAAMHVHHRWAQAMTLTQVAIALAAITLLTRSRRLQFVSYAAGAIAVAIGGLALMHI